MYIPGLSGVESAVGTAIGDAFKSFASSAGSTLLKALGYVLFHTAEGLATVLTKLMVLIVFRPYGFNATAQHDALVMQGIALGLLPLGFAYVGIKHMINKATGRVGIESALGSRWMVGAVMCVASFKVCWMLLALNNAIAQEFIHLAGTTRVTTFLDAGSVLVVGGGAGVAVGGGIGLTIAGSAPAWVPLVLGGFGLLVAGMVLFLIIGYVVRTAEIIFFGVTMPLWGVLWSFEATAGITSAAWAEFCAAVFTQAMQAILWWLAVQFMFSNSTAVGFWQFCGNATTSIGILYLSVKVPGILRAFFSNRVAGGQSFLGSLVVGGRVATVLATGGTSGAVAKVAEGASKISRISGL